MTTADWAGETAVRWLKVADHLEAQIAPVSDILFEFADLVVGERVLDVGCGRGTTTRRAARDIGPSGSVLAVDVAAPLIDTAREQPCEGAPVTWAAGDAQGYAFAAGARDVVISRFGVMFFDDSIAAFGNLRRATAVGGRLAVAVWQARDRNEVLQRPLDVAQRVAAQNGVELALPGPTEGPFSLGDAATAQTVLGAAGWSDVAFHPRDLTLYASGPGTPEEVVDIAMTLGPLHYALVECSEAFREVVRQEVVDDFTPLHDGIGVPLGASIAIITARAG
jgi:SAM-dependent methyltransferase